MRHQCSILSAQQSDGSVTVSRQVLGQEDVWQHFTTVLDNLLVVCNVVHVGSWEQLQAFLADFAARRPGKSVMASCDSTPAPCVAWCLLRLLACPLFVTILACLRLLACSRAMVLLDSCPSL